MFLSGQYLVLRATLFQFLLAHLASTTQDRRYDAGISMKLTTRPKNVSRNQLFFWASVFGNQLARSKPR